MTRCAKCDKPVIARGLCHRHYKQWQTHGGDAKRVRAEIAKDPLAYVLERLVKETDSGCLIYQGEKNRHGYGRFRLKGKTILVHRFIYQQFVGPIPDRYDLDHLCRRSACAEPTHLEAVTHQVNCQRGLRGDLRHA